MTSNRVAECRKAVGLTQRVLADRVGVTSQTISNIERGGPPNVRLALRLAEALGTPVEALFGSTQGIEQGGYRGASQAATRACKGTHGRDRTAPKTRAGKSAGKKAA